MTVLLASASAAPAYRAELAWPDAPLALRASVYEGFEKVADVRNGAAAPDSSSKEELATPTTPRPLRASGVLETPAHEALETYRPMVECSPPHERNAAHRLVPTLPMVMLGPNRNDQWLAVRRRPVSFGSGA